MLAGVEFDPARAEALLAAVDRHDLIGWLDGAQRKENQWKSCCYRLFHDVRRWHDHLEQERNPDPIPEGEPPE